MEIVSQVIFALNRMVDVNDQRSIRYKYLSSRSKELEMKLFFMQYAVQAQTFTVTLNKWRNAYGAPLRTTKKESFIDTTVYQVRKMIGGRTYELTKCEQMESNALKTYKAALALSFLPTSALEDIVKQCDELEKVHYALQALRENGAQQWQAAFA